MDNQNERAKGLFSQFLGNLFNMHQAGVLEEYKKYNIPKEMEWVKYYQDCRIAVEIFEGIISQPLVIDPGHEMVQLNLKDKRS